MLARKTIFPLLLTLILFSVTVRTSEANFEGTIGTRFTITGSEFGIKKPKVYVQYEKRPGVIKKINAKVEIWSETSVTCLWTKKLPSGTYNLLVQPTNKGASPIAEGTFAVMNPLIDEVTPGIVGVFPDTIPFGETITMTGQYFGSKKPIVYLEDLDSLKRKRCRVFNATMDPATGASSLNFIVPRWRSNNYQIILKTRVGETSFYYPMEPLTTWTVRNPSPVDFPFVNKVAFAKGLFVSVGSGIHTSPDGINWTKRSSDISLVDITYGNGTFVAVGGNGAILTSPDGSVWTSINADITYLSLGAVTYGNGTFVAVGGNGIILTSPDGATWTPRDSRITDPLDGVTFGNGTFVAVGINGIVLTSSDGVTWEPRSSGTTSYLNGVTYGNGIFVVVGYYPEGVILTSPDGVTWTFRNSGTANQLKGATFGNGLFVAVGENGTILTSPDGTIWTSRDSGIDSDFDGVTYGNGTFIVVGYIGISTSADGITWTSRSSGTTRNLNGVTYGNGTFVAVSAYSTTIVTSPDGITWTERNSGTTEEIAQVTYFNNTFVALAGGNTRNTILTSPDGIEWTTRYSETDVYFSGVTYGNGTFVAVGSNGKIVTSSDGVEWTIRDSGITDPLDGVVFGNGTFVAVSELGTIFTSPDGVAWTSRKSGTSHALYDITYGNGTFVAVGENIVCISTDGLAWKSEVLSSDSSRFPTYPRLSKVIFAGGIFVSLGGIIHVGPTPGSTSFSTAIFSSADGVIWTKKSFGSIPLSDSPYGFHALSGIAYGNDTIVAVGRYGTIVQSDPLDSFYTGTPLSQ